VKQIIFPDWLTWIDKNLKWLSIPKLPLILTLIQAFGFILVTTRLGFVDKLILKPSAVLQGEVWRIFTFMAIPLINNFLIFLVLWFLYHVMLALEEAWGSTLFTVYFLLAWLCSVLAALLTGVPVETFINIKFSFFFALATLNPNRTIYLFFILPIAFKWLAVFIAVVLLCVPFFLGSPSQQLYIILLFANYLTFFGKDFWLRFKKELDKRKQ
jgi:hypothetical protein